MSPHNQQMPAEFAFPSECRQNSEFALHAKPANSRVHATNGTHENRGNTGETKNAPKPPRHRSPKPRPRAVRLLADRPSRFRVSWCKQALQWTSDLPKPPRSGEALRSLAAFVATAAGVQGRGARPGWASGWSSGSAAGARRRVPAPPDASVLAVGAEREW